jgi:hypothetical protein
MMGGWFGDAWDLLAGKPQSWYTNVSGIQNQLSIVMAGIAEAGRDIWNTVSGAASGPSQDGTPASGVDDFDVAQAAIDQALTSIIVTKSHVPTDAVISAAKQTAMKYQKQLDFVIASAPEVAREILAYQDSVAQQLPGPMSSPSAVGRDAFMQELEDRSKVFGQGAMDVLKWVAIGLLGAGLLWGMAK